MNNFWSSKNTIKKMNRLGIDWKNIFTTHISDQGLISRIYLLNFYK